jgi:sterol desaturase/sphingolipid hydroxylase (fatty acid hydroxylase superfamily)
LLQATASKSSPERSDGCTFAGSLGFMDWMATIGGFWLNTLAWLAGLAVAFGVLARLTPCNPGMYWWKNLRAVGADFLYWFLGPLFSRLCGVLLLIAAVGLLFGGNPPQLLPVADWPLWQQAVAILLIQDLLMYWIHRLFHTRLAWKFHAVHHSPTVLDWLSTVRFHPVNTVLEFTLADVTVLLMGFAPQALIILAPVTIVYSTMVHANLNWTFGPLRYVFASPVFHRWHHTNEREGLNKNFAPTFPFLDVVFGTFYMPPGRLPEQFGNGEADFPEGFLGQLVYPFRGQEPLGKGERLGSARRLFAVMVPSALAILCLVGGGMYCRSRLAALNEKAAEQYQVNVRPAPAKAPRQVIAVHPKHSAGSGKALGQASATTAVALSADGQMVVVGRKNGMVEVCDAATGQAKLTLTGHPGRVNCVALSADGLCIVSGGSDSKVKVWDAATGQEKLTLFGHRGAVLSVAVSAAGRCVVSGSADGTVKVWDVATGRERLTLTGETDAFPSVAISGDGRRVVAADLGAAKVWDAQTGREELTLRGHTELVLCVAISPDGRRIVSGSLDGTARVWDGLTGREEFLLKGHKGSVFSVAISPDGRCLVSGSNDGTAKVWDAEAGREELTLGGDADSITSVAVSTEGRRVVSGTREGSVRVWDADPLTLPVGTRVRDSFSLQSPSR